MTRSSHLLIMILCSAASLAFTIAAPTARAPRAPLGLALLDDPVPPEPICDTQQAISADACVDLDSNCAGAGASCVPPWSAQPDEECQSKSLSCIRGGVAAQLDRRSIANAVLRCRCTDVLAQKWPDVVCISCSGTCANGLNY